MNNKYIFLFIFITTSLFISCSLIWPTVEIEVPKNYVGWVTVIPVIDTSGLQIEKPGGKYKINEFGVAYVPATILNIKKDHRILVFQEDEDISKDMRYAGTVHSVTENKKVYDYSEFYLPSMNERKIADGVQYWRDKRWEYTYSHGNRFDSLIKIGKITFK